MCLNVPAARAVVVRLASRALALEAPVDSHKRLFDVAKCDLRPQIGTATPASTVVLRLATVRTSTKDRCALAFGERERSTERGSKPRTRALSAVFWTPLLAARHLPVPKMRSYPAATTESACGVWARAPAGEDRRWRLMRNGCPSAKQVQSSPGWSVAQSV